MQSPQQPVGEEPGEDVVQDEVEVHHRLDREDETQEGCRVEDVTVPGGDERQAPEQLRIPQRHVSQAVPPLGAPRPEGVAGRVLVAPGRGQYAAGYAFRAW